tara:strand:- start:291 stop:584 length:294 start_codon:yes stop_codon:yes gene_type:complete
MIEYTVKVFDTGTKHWLLNGKLHREDGPAIEYADGGKYWYLDGKRHREDGPAIEWADGDKCWYLDGREVTEQEVMNPSCSGKIVEIDGKKYKLEEVS